MDETTEFTAISPAHWLDEDDVSEKAVGAASEAARIDPQNVEAWDTLASLQIRRRWWREGLTAARRALAIAPDHLSALTSAAECAWWLFELDEAERCWTRAMAFSLEHAALQRRLDDLRWLRGECSRLERCRGAERITMATSVLERLQHPSVLCLQAGALRQAGHPTKALAAYNAALAMHPQSANAWRGISHPLRDSGALEEALGACERSLALDPEPAQSWHAKGLVLSELGDPIGALEASEVAISIDPRFAMPWNVKGNSLKAMGCADKAFEAYQRAIEIDPQFGFPWNNKGLLLGGNPHLACGEETAAGCVRRCLWLKGGPRSIGSFCQAYEASRTPLAAWRWMSTLQVGFIQSSAPLRQLARDSLVSLMDVVGVLPAMEADFSPEGLRNLAVVNSVFGDPFSAIPLWRGAVERHPEDLEAKWWLADQLLEVLELPEREAVLVDAERLAETALHTLQREEFMFIAGLVFADRRAWEKAARCFDGCRGALNIPALLWRWQAAFEMDRTAEKRSVVEEILTRDDAAIRRGETSYLLPGIIPSTSAATVERVVNTAMMTMRKQWSEPPLFDFLSDDDTLKAIAQSSGPTSRLAQKVLSGAPIDYRSVSWRWVRAEQAETTARLDMLRATTQSERESRPEVARILCAMGLTPHDESLSIKNTLSRHIQTQRVLSDGPHLLVVMELFMLHGKLDPERFVLFKAYIRYKQQLESVLPHLGQSDSVVQALSDLGDVVTVPLGILTLAMLDVSVATTAVSAGLATLPLALRRLIDAHERRLDISQFPSFEEFVDDLEKYDVARQ